MNLCEVVGKSEVAYQLKTNDNFAHISLKYDLATIIQKVKNLRYNKYKK